MTISLFIAKDAKVLSKAIHFEPELRYREESKGYLLILNTTRCGSSSSHIRLELLIEANERMFVKAEGGLLDWDWVLGYAIDHDLPIRMVYATFPYNFEGVRCQREMGKLDFVFRFSGNHEVVVLTQTDSNSQLHGYRLTEATFIPLKWSETLETLEPSLVWEGESITLSVNDKKSSSRTFRLERNTESVRGSQAVAILHELRARLYIGGGLDGDDERKLMGLFTEYSKTLTIFRHHIGLSTFLSDDESVAFYFNPSNQPLLKIAESVIDYVRKTMFAGQYRMIPNSYQKSAQKALISHILDDVFKDSGVNKILGKVVQMTHRLYKLEEGFRHVDRVVTVDKS